MVLYFNVWTMLYVAKYLMKSGVSVCTVHKHILIRELHSMKVVERLSQIAHVRKEARR